MSASGVVRVILVCVLGLSLGESACAQDYPVKAIRLVLPFPPGGFTDVTARVLAQQLSERFGQPVIVDNKPGGGTVIGAEIVARAQPDGYTLLYTGGSTFTVNPVLIKNLPYDPLKSFTAVGVLGKTSMALLANPSVPANSIKELIALVLAKPGQYAYGSFGNGTTSHFAGEMFASTVGVKLLHVPYKGSAFSMNDLIGGQIPLSFDTIVVAAPQVRAGKIKAIAVTTQERSSLLPDVPTVAESGYPGFDLGTWVGLVAPAGTPDSVVKKLREELVKILAMKGVRESFQAIGVEPARPDAEEFVKLVQSEIQRYSQIAKDANIKAD